MNGSDASSMYSDTSLVEKGPRTATGKELKLPSDKEKAKYAWSAWAGAESWGGGAPAHLPVAFNADSLISVPVLRPEDVGKTEPAKSKKSFFSSSRRSSNTNFIIRKIPQHEYLKWYAKDDNGQYIGTEQPANDCILRGEDLGKYRNG